MANGLGAEGFYRPALERGWTVASPDLRGHGRSVASSFALEEWAGDLLAVLDECGWERAWLGGGSLGAAVAVAAAGLAPARVDGLLLIAPAHAPEVNPALAQFAELGGAYREGCEAGEAAVRRLMPDASPELLEFRLANLRGRPPEAVAGMLEAVAGWTLDLETLGRIAGPVAVLAWEGDPVHPVASARSLAAAAPRGRVQLLGPETLGGDPAVLLEAALRCAQV
jgi:3-oxoadipate enol-lactonase/4-carboxymuconolactone decarboxylase